MPHPDLPAIGRPTAPLLRAAELRIWSEAEDARRAAREIADRTRAEARDTFERERDRGHAEGFAAGAEEAARVVANASAAANAMLQRIEADLPGIVHGILENVLGAFPASELVAPAVRRALGRVRLGASATLRTAPGDLLVLRAALDGLSEVPPVRLEPDPELEPGRCVLNTEFGAVELGVAAQLRALKAALVPVAEATP